MSSYNFLTANGKEGLTISVSIIKLFFVKAVSLQLAVASQRIQYNDRHLLVIKIETSVFTWIDKLNKAGKNEQKGNILKSWSFKGINLFTVLYLFLNCLLSQLLSQC